MATQRLIIAGFGGQGVMLIGEVIAYAAMIEGKEVTWMPSYGPEMRGGTANCMVVISDEPIASPVISEASSLIAMNKPSLDKFESSLSAGGNLLFNRSLIDQYKGQSGAAVYPINCNEIAVNLHNDKAANMVMLGAILHVTGVVSEKSAFAAMEKLFTGKKASFIPSNMEALAAGAKEARECAESGDHSNG